LVKLHQCTAPHHSISPPQATLALAESVQGPQDIELELLMEMYYQVTAGL
jgi:hypothetical protein